MAWQLFLLLLAAANADETCLSADEDPYLLFGTKTAYIFANRGIPTTRAHDVPGCEPIAFWLASRHGSHNPEAEEIGALQALSDLKNNIVSNYRNGNFRNTNQHVCTSDFNLLERWEWNSRINATFAGDLTSDGYMTTQQLAKAWKQRFPGILNTNSHNYVFKVANDRRSRNTFHAFTEGLFGAQAEGYDIPQEHDEKILRPHEHCPVWMDKVEKNNDTLSQMRIFTSKQEYREMLTNVSRRLGFNYDIRPEFLLQIYQMCRYNKAWDVTLISPWCAAFTHDDLKRLEYAEDLATYYKYGYGSDLSQKIGCTFVKDMINFFEKHVSNEAPQQPRASIQLTESAALLLLLTSLGAHRDAAPLTGDNYHMGTARDRHWRTSRIDPFNANVAAVLYKCSPNGNFQIRDQYQVLFLENEHPMTFDGCRVGLCDWSLVKSKFDVTGCDLEFCNSANKSYISYGIALVLLLRFVLS